MSCQKLIDHPETCADDVLMGFGSAYPGLQVLQEVRAVVTAPAASAGPSPVGMVCGGGAGHEPLCIGFVGDGMLAGVVSGSVFAAPPATNVAKTLKSVGQLYPGGVLLIMGNYTGDLLNFGLASEWAKKDGIKVETLAVGDDCAVLDSGKGTTATRRGMVGLVFVFKIAGHLAASGASLETISKTAKKVAANMATMGFALKGCTLPGSSTPLFSLDAGKVEFGIGVHGEAGVKTIPMASASSLVKELLRPIVETLNLKRGSKVAVLINNVGGLSQLELWILPGIVRQQLEAEGMEVVRIYTGTMMTTLESVGVQISVLNLSGEDSNSQQWVECLDAPTSAPAWPGSQLSVPRTAFLQVHPQGASPADFVGTESFGPKIEQSWAKALKQALKTASQAIISKVDRLNELDSGCGDGDCGSTLSRLAKVILSKLSVLHVEYPAQLLQELADLASSSMGGTSGAVYGLLFSGASSELNASGNSNILNGLIKSWKRGLETVMQYSRARVGDRTMLDALIPACDEFERVFEKTSNGIKALKAALDAAQIGCDGTGTLLARVGRASYVNDARLSGDVDAGAYGVVVWLEALYGSFSESAKP